jgi:hypothetical protein
MMKKIWTLMRKTSGISFRQKLALYSTLRVPNFAALPRWYDLNLFDINRVLL